MKQTAAQGSCVAAIALLFGVNALRYPTGTLDRPGPGLFPLVVSTALLMISGAILLGARRPAGATVDLRWRNIGILLLALLGFVAATRLSVMAVGIVVLVFIAGLAARRPSLARSAALAAALVAIAFGFQRLLGLRLQVF